MKPAPYPPTTRAKGWTLKLDVERVERSATWSLAHEEPMLRGVHLLMLAEAWRSEPCGSLAADDATLAARGSVPLLYFVKHKAILLREWWIAEDGRLYIDVLVDQVREMLAHRRRGYLRHFDEVIAAHGERCIYCGRPDRPLTLDHVIPKSRGGQDEPSNLVPACKPCNSSKGARTPEEWRRR